MKKAEIHSKQLKIVYNYTVVEATRKLMARSNELYGNALTKIVQG